MTCKGCPKPIKKGERTHIERDPAGKLVATWHLKCWHTAQKRGRWAKQGRARETVTPYDTPRKTKDDVEQMAAADAARAALQEQRDLEESPHRFDDWRTE